MSKDKKIIIIVSSIILLLVIIILIAFGRLNSKTNKLNTDYTVLRNDIKYNNEVIIGAEIIKQDVSCGYAVIEMFAKWSGNNEITEESLYDKYNKVVTSTGRSFENEMNKQFPKYKTTMYKYLDNKELIEKVYDSLAKGIPVPFEWAAKNDGVWTLHYSLIIGIDIPNDRIKIANPYGYMEDITIQEFLDRTSYNAYDNMPL